MEIIRAEELFGGESKNIEFKREIPNRSDKYMKTVVAFANSGGGKLIFGVEDKTCQVVGIPQDGVFRTMDSITNAICDSCTPIIIPDITLQTIEDKLIIVVQIYPGGQRPYYITAMGKAAGTYLRIAGTSRPADEYLLMELEFEGANRCFDQTYAAPREVTEAKIQALCDSIKDHALKLCKNEDEKAVLKDVTKKNLLSWGVLVEKEDRVLPTNAFILLTDNDFLQAKVQCAVFKGTTRGEFLDRREYTGPIYEQIDEAYEFVLRNIRYGAQFEGLYRVDRYELPVSCIREMITNAVTHRSYLNPGCVQVAVFDNRVEVTSPGMLFSGLTLTQMKEGYSKPRNRAIANVFTYMKIIEQWGSGIPKMMDSCRKFGIREPEFIEFGVDFRVNLYREAAGGIVSDAVGDTMLRDITQTMTYFPEYTLQRATQTMAQTIPPVRKYFLTEPDKEVLQAILRCPQISQRDIALELGWNVDRVKYYEKKLREKKILRRVGSHRTGYWEVSGELQQCITPFQ